MPRQKTEAETKEVSSRKDFQETLSGYDYEHLLEEYKELNEEVRYRDRIMHNSYYLIAIAIVFFLGNIVNWEGSSRISSSVPEFVVLFGASGGALLIFISVVMDTYNEKRVRAEHRRKDIEVALNKSIEENEIDTPPFAIQDHVINGELDWYPGREASSRTNRWINQISKKAINNYSVWLFRVGALLLMASVGSVVWIVYNFF